MSALSCTGTAEGGNQVFSTTMRLALAGWAGYTEPRPNTTNATDF